ncbi:MAG: hypothetical protein ACYDCO_12085 [Armatimonadota bacterium]
MKRLTLFLIILLGFACSVKGAPIQLGVPIPIPDAAQAPAYNHSFDDAQRAGATVVQIRAEWPRIQPDANTWNFSTLDALVARATARKLEVVLVFGPAPCWTVTYLKNPSPQQLARARPDAAAYAKYVTAVTKRYANRVKYYQPWERPNGSTLLATAEDTWKLYRIAAKAVHAVNPALKVVAPEPGDVQLGWIYNYLRGCTGTERPDVLLLSAVSDRATPDALARRFQLLHSRVLPKPAPALWGSVIAATEQEWGWTAAASLLLQNVSTLIVQPAAVHRDICAKPAFLGELQSLASLTGQQYLGWQRVGSAMAGAFGSGKQQCAVILPDSTRDEDAALRFVASAKPVDSGIAVPAQCVTVRRLSGTTQQIDVKKEVCYPLSPRPVILSGVLLSPTAGAPPWDAAQMTCERVSLDLDGADPAAIRPLRNMPGGKYQQMAFDGKVEMLITVRETAPWIYLDVPDDYLFFNIDRQPVEVAVRVRGVQTAKKSGVSLYYDGIGGMANSRWQWVDVGPFAEYTYTFRLDNALFAGSEGYDLRLDMGGSTESIKLLGMTVRKLSR